MGGGRKARWQRTSPFRIPVYFRYLTNTNTGARPVLIHDLTPVPNESELSSCSSRSHKAQCPANTKWRFHLGTLLTPLMALVFILSNRLMVQTEAAPNGHGHVPRGNGATRVLPAIEENHLNVLGSCQGPGATRICLTYLGLEGQ